MGPEALAQVLRPLAGMFHAKAWPDLLRGLGEPDDAAVWKLDAERALVLTADFFPPVVDDPYAYGAIAAANALSDLYAMGAVPLFALNLASFPADLDPAVLAEILRGGADKVREAGAVVAGGHTTTDPEPKFGLAAAGLVHPDRVLTKGGAQPGDVFVLTKPIGSGLITTAAMRDRATPAELETAIASMSRLNQDAGRLLRSLPPGAVHALTDITGFGLGGHAHEMALASDLAVRFHWPGVPLLPGAETYAREGLSFGGARRNVSYYGAHVRGADVPEWVTALLFDPQTSGGLLAAVSPEHVAPLLELFDREAVPAWRIAVAEAGPAGELRL
ncbi:MAG TPA: selenide, water dikinase SelD [Candidatus Polarisedimenticolaceae bacterium]|nr:selenide, water dikinase SelD [Candidatus Polarisedimenticolaceae bacterium]